MMRIIGYIVAIVIGLAAVIVGISGTAQLWPYSTAMAAKGRLATAQKTIPLRKSLNCLP
jgi:hypothetical protein